MTVADLIGIVIAAILATYGVYCVVLLIDFFIKNEPIGNVVTLTIGIITSIVILTLIIAGIIRLFIYLDTIVIY